MESNTCVCDMLCKTSGNNFPFPFPEPFQNSQWSSQPPMNEWLQCDDTYCRNIQHIMEADCYVELLVGGLRYSIATADLLWDQDSFFATVLKKEWKQSGEVPITIERDGAIFKYVYVFLVTRQLPRNAEGFHTLDAATLGALRMEADFYNLTSLMQECDTSNNVALMSCSGKLTAYATIQKYVNQAKKDLGRLDPYHLYWQSNLTPYLTCEYSAWDSAALLNVLGSVWLPFCLIGIFPVSHYVLQDGNPLIFKSSSITQLNVAELLTAATPSAFGRGTEFIFDSNVRASLEIPADQLNAAALKGIAECIDIAELAPMMKLELRPYKLVIYQEGGHFDQHRDTVRGDNHIGTLVVILNSEYTGGELEISHGGQTEVVTGPYSWAAMYGDCLHKINPVTSGTRVSLIYDIYRAAGESRWEEATGDAVEYESGAGSDGEGADGEDDEPYIDENYYQIVKYINVQRDYHHSDERAGPADAQRDARRLRLMKAMSEEEQSSVLTALESELATHDFIVICLAHMYPACQSNPSYLKGGDLALYKLLRDRYDVSVEPVAVFTSDFHDMTMTAHMQATIFAMLFRDVELEVARAKEEERQQVARWQSGVSQPTHPPKRPPAKNAKLVIPCNLDAGRLLDYSPYTDHAANEPQEETAVYCIVGLQVAKKACMASL